MIIGIAGTLAAGKGTVVEYLKERRGFAHYSVSGILKDMLEEDGVSASRAHLSALADKLNEQYEGGILHVANERAKADGVKDYILESIHRESEATYVRSLGGIILGVDADAKKRYERTMKRQEGEKDNVTYEEFLERIQHEEEGKGSGSPHIRAVIENADFVVTNNGTLEELHAQIDEVLKKI